MFTSIDLLNHYFIVDFSSYFMRIPYFFYKLGKMSQNLSSAAVRIGTLRVKFELFAYLCRLLITFANRLDPDQAQYFVGLALDPICLGV